MGRIDKRSGQDGTLERRHINMMLRCINEYEEVKNRSHKEFKTAQEFYDRRGVCKQNFLKYYRRFLIGNREVSSLLPHKTGRKFKDCLSYLPDIIDNIKEIRSRGYNKFDIVNILKVQKTIEISPS